MEARISSSYRVASWEATEGEGASTWRLEPIRTRSRVKYSVSSSSSDWTTSWEVNEDVKLGGRALKEFLGYLHASSSYFYILRALSVLLQRSNGY